MAVSKDSPHRRRSIAVTNQNKPIVLSKAKRRAHSIVPGDRLSPLAKARRSLVPRKSILKVSIVSNAENAQNESQSSTAQLNSQLPPNDDSNSTQSMEMTQDLRPTNENVARKSLGRRVSFAQHCHVRTFEKDKNHTSSTGSPASSPSSAPSSDDQPPQLNDENAHPASFSRNRRRSSMRQSLGSEDMDMTTIGAAFYPGSAIADDDNQSDDAYDDDMDVTDVIHGDFIRKRSMSLGVRHPLSQIAVSPNPGGASVAGEEDLSQSSLADESILQSDADSERSQGMEFTVPLSQSLRPPACEDEIWLALRKATHSGNTSIEMEPASDDDYNSPNAAGGMDLDNAMQRLMNARTSLPLHHELGGNISSDYETGDRDPQDDTISSANDSFTDDQEDGNRTMNVSKVLGRLSTGGESISRMSFGFQGDDMEESEIYGAVVPPIHSTPRQTHPYPAPSSSSSTTVASAPQQEPPKSGVFQPPPPSILPQSRVQANHASTLPITFSFTPKVPNIEAASTPTSKKPSPIKSKASFSAAFAPPVARPSPKKSVVSTNAVGSPGKRMRSSRNEGSDIENDEIDKPSPAKRQAMAGKWLETSMVTGESPTANAPKPKPLSPSKKNPFQVAGLPGSEAPISQASSALRRPSGYFARRKSLGVGVGVTQPFNETSAVQNSLELSSKKKIGIGLGRASIDSAPVDAWKRFDKTMPIPVNPKLSITDETTEERNTISQEHLPSDIISSSPLQNSPLNEDKASVRALDATEKWRDEVQQDEFPDDDTPIISIEQFFVMTGIKFMDELAAPRRSMHQPSRQPRPCSAIPLAEYAIAMGIDIPQLMLYSRVSNDLQAWMEKSKAVFADAEEEAAKVTPELFIEYSMANEEGQAELLHQLNLIRTNTRGLAKSDWYDWKLQWVEGLCSTAEKAFKALEEDAMTLESVRSVADELIPTLEKEYNEIMAELEDEKKQVAEIEASDQDYLNELKMSIAEQNVEVEALQTEVTEANDQLRWLNERFEDIELQKKEAQDAIAKAQRVLQIQENSTRSEVLRLKDELEALEDLHMFRATRVTADIFEYVYASQFLVSIPCKNFLPVVTKVNVNRIDAIRRKFKDDFPRLSNFLLTNANYIVQKGDENIAVRQVIHILADYWSSCAQIRLQLKLLKVKFPVDIEIEHPSEKEQFAGFRAKATVMFPSVKAKAVITFIFPTEVFSQWPMSVNSLDCDVQVVYGPIDRSLILKAAVERLRHANPSDNYACLLDSCIEAQDVYS